MLKDWIDILNIKSDVRFGHIIDKKGIALFFNEDNEIQIIINNLKSMIESKEDNSSIMIAGHAGVGKTTLVHYINNVIDSSKYCLFIINGEECMNSDNVIQAINNNFSNYYNVLFSEVNDNENNEYNEEEKEEIKKILNTYFSESEYSNSFEKNRLNLETYNKLYENNIIFESNKLRKIRIFLDQIDLLDNSEMLNILQNSFTPIIHSRYITAIICARYETMKSAIKSVNNFFATNFSRFIEMKYIPAELILSKRLNASSSKEISLKYFNNIFPKDFCNFLNGTQNLNIRKILLIYERIMTVIPPVVVFKDATKIYINFLFNNGYIDNLYKKINPTDNIPMIKIIFDAIQFCSIINERFFMKISVKISMLLNNISNINGCTTSNMNSAIAYLKSRSLITDTFDIPEKYSLTSKGETYKNLINTDVYRNMFCKTKQDLIFAENNFLETDFL